MVVKTLAAITAGANAISSIGGLFGGGGLSARKSAALQAQYQREQMQNAIQWRVQDAKKAGIHPLAALGVATGGSPINVVGNERGAGDRLRDFGQDISRSVGAYSDQRMRAKQMEQQTRLNEINIKQAELELAASASQLARVQSGATVPINANNPNMPGQGNYVQQNPQQVTRPSPGLPHSEPGQVVDTGWSRTNTGGLAPVPSEDVKQRIEDQFIPELMWAIRNLIKPNMPWNWNRNSMKPPRS